MKWYDIISTGNPNYPCYHLTHYNGSKDYTVMLYQSGSGYFPLLSRPTISEAREALKNWI